MKRADADDAASTSSTSTSSTSTSTSRSSTSAGSLGTDVDFSSIRNSAADSQVGRPCVIRPRAGIPPGTVFYPTLGEDQPYRKAHSLLSWRAAADMASSLEFAVSWSSTADGKGGSTCWVAAGDCARDLLERCLAAARVDDAGSGLRAPQVDIPELGEDTPASHSAQPSPGQSRRSREPTSSGRPRRKTALEPAAAAGPTAQVRHAGHKRTTPDPVPAGNRARLVLACVLQSTRTILLLFSRLGGHGQIASGRCWQRRWGRSQTTHGLSGCLR